MGIGAPAIEVAGPAQVDFNIAGTWAGFASPVASGKMQIHDTKVRVARRVRALARQLPPIVMFAGQSVSVTSFTASFQDGASVSGSADFPMRCTDAFVLRSAL